MRRCLALRRTAEREFDEAIAWYESERVGLGEEFRARVQRQFELVADDPELFPIVRNEVRRAVIARRFPYVIHFLIEPKRIVILSVFHTSRDPAQLKFRK